MKIYEIGTGYTPIPAQMGAATEIVVEELTRSFLKMGEDVNIIDIASFDRANTDLPIIEVRIPNIFAKKDVSLGLIHKLKRVFYSIALAGKLKNILKNSSEKVVLHFHNQYNLFFFLKLISPELRKKAIVAYTVHSYIWGTEWDEINDTVKKKYFQEVFSVKNADIVFVLNDITIKHFTERLNVDKNRIHKILNGVNTSRYTTLSVDEITKFKSDLGLTDKKIIFQVGSVCERKNQLGSVKMLTEYLNNHRDVVYMYAGGIIDDDYQQSIIDFANQNYISEQVKYVGEIAPGEQLNYYYNIADCSVFTSTLESFGLVIIEAISAGTKVIIGNNLMFDLNSGYSMYSSEEEFVSLVDSALFSEQHENCQYCDAIKKYDWNSVAKDFIEIFENTVRECS